MVILSNRIIPVCNISQLNSNSAECNVILQYKDMERFAETQQISSSCTGIKSHTTKLSYVNCMVNYPFFPYAGWRERSGGLFRAHVGLCVLAIVFTTTIRPHQVNC